MGEKRIHGTDLPTFITENYETHGKNQGHHLRKKLPNGKNIVEVSENMASNNIFKKTGLQ